MQRNRMTGKTVAILAESGPVGNMAEPVIQAILDVAYLLGNLDGWFSEKQDLYFEIIAAGLGKKPADVSPDAVGLNAKLAHLRGKVSEEDLLNSFGDGVGADCRAFDGASGEIVRRAVALWIVLSLADGRISPVCRRALELLLFRLPGFRGAAELVEFPQLAEALLREAVGVEVPIDREEKPECCAVLLEQYQAKVRMLQILISAPPHGGNREV